MVSAIGANPMAKASAANRLLNDAQNEMSDLQAQAINEANGSPKKSLLISLIARAATIISLARTFFEEAIQQLRSDQEATKATHQLANAAR